MIICIDGNNLSHRIFHTKSGVLTTKDGTPSGVIIGVMKSIRGYLEQFPEATRIIVCWDGGRSKWRKSLYPEYKAQRDYGEQDPDKKKAYDGLWMQMEELHEFLPSLGVYSIKIPGQEADDLMAGITEFNNTGHHIMHITSDKDMLQLVNENTSVYSPYKDRVITPLNFYDETGVTMESYVGYRALVGDSSDNITGISGIGEKTAKKLMDKYGHIDNILNATDVDKTKLMKSKRTARIFEPQGLRTLGLNNRIMSFKFCEYEEMKSEIEKALNDNEDVFFKGKEVKDFCIKWQFVSILSDYTAWSMLFSSLGDDI